MTRLEQKSYTLQLKSERPILISDLNRLIIYKLKIMKQFLLVCLFTVCAFAQINAQFCEPNQMYADSVFGVYPPPYDTLTMTGGISESACINSPYTFQLTFRIPEEIMIPSPPITAEVNSIQVTGITGLPEGMAMACNPPTCIFTPDDVLGCAVIYGTANNTNAPGEYPLELQGTVSTNIADIDFATLFAFLGTGSYTLTLEEEGSPDCFVSTSVDEYLNDHMTVTTAPNPFVDRTNITINSDVNETLQFNVTNLLGEVVHSESVRIVDGENNIEFDGSYLANGIYHFTFSNGDAALTQKVVLAR